MGCGASGGSRGLALFQTMCNERLINRQKWHIEKAEAESWVSGDPRILASMRKHLHATVTISKSEEGTDWCVRPGLTRPDRGFLQG